ncbi:MAG: hypothetical protein IT383_06535 [Deltaproteobacteria bacterium]|nr:hypothetical protein [Deltaproteobacteria bacterium]
MICPKCGRPVDEAAVICRGCDFILDTQFLGDGILDEEHELRPGQGGVDPAAFNLADAVILGNIDEDSQSFETSDSGFHLAANMQARLYVSGRSQAMMAPDAVPALAQSIEGVRLTPFERHVLNFIDGRRPVEVIRRAAGLDEAEVKTALATLADKGVVKVVGRALADWDAGAETVPRRAPQRPRVRGSMVGAVALVGDDADRAIDAAFRTQVLGLHDALKDVQVNDEGGAFAKRGDSALPDDADQFLGLKGTDEVKKKETTTSTVRPSDVKQAVNRVAPPTNALRRPDIGIAGEDSQEGIDASAEMSAVGIVASASASKADASDGFDEFSAPSVVSTAVLDGAAPSSSLPSEASQHGKGDVFAEASDSGGGRIAAVEELADSRVRRRPPVVAPVAAALPALASESESGNIVAARLPSARSPADSMAATHASAIGSSSGANSEEIERRAASGEVWGDAPNPQTGESASLMQLLSEGDSHTANVPPDHAARLLAGRDARSAPMPSSEASEEPTAAGQPPPPLKLPRVPGVAAVPLATSARPPRRSAGSGLVSMPDEHATGPVDEHSGLFGASPARVRARAHHDDDEVDFEGPETTAARPHKSSSTGEPPPRERSPAPRPPAPRTAAVAPPPAELSSGPSRDDSQHSESSVELLDSGLVIRPAARAVPLTAALRHTRQQESSNPRNRPMADPPSAASTPRPSQSGEEHDEQEDTVNLEPGEAARVVGGPRVAVAGPRGVAAIPSGFSQVIPAESAPRSKAAVSDEVRRKALKLMDEAKKEFGAGRLASARMNAKLASIYDPENEEIRALQRQWEQPAAPPPTAGRATPATKNSDEAQAEVKALYDRAQQLEDDEDIDGALDVLEEGVERFPNEAAFHNRMGVILALKKRDFEGAVAAIQRAIEIAPDNLHYKNNLGKIVAKVRTRQPEA